MRVGFSGVDRSRSRLGSMTTMSAADPVRIRPRSCNPKRQAGREVSFLTASSVGIRSRAKPKSLGKAPAPRGWEPPPMPSEQPIVQGQDQNAVRSSSLIAWQRMVAGLVPGSAVRKSLMIRSSADRPSAAAPSAKVLPTIPGYFRHSVTLTFSGPPTWSRADRQVAGSSKARLAVKAVIVDCQKRYG